MTTPPSPHPHWRHAIELGPVLTGCVFAAASVLSFVRAPALLVIIAAIVAAGSVAVASALLAQSWHGVSYLTAAAVVAAGWLAYATLRTPWSWPAVAALVLPAMLLTALWPALRAYEQRIEDEERRRKAAAEASAEARKWPDLLAKIGCKGVRFVSREDTRCGYDVRLRLPDHGRVTFSGLAKKTEPLEVAARARRGSLRFEQFPDDAAHELVLHVAERDVLAEVVPLPTETRRRSINQPVPIGLHEDGGLCTVTLREVATLIIGLRGSGKSNLLNVLVAQLARCVDVLIWVIDLKGGRMARPWLEPWLAGQTPRPVIDWLATTREEAALMQEAALRAIAARSHAHDGREKIIPSAHEPAIMIICDEGAVLMGQNMGGPKTSADGVTNLQLSNNNKQITVLGRSEAIDVILASQRGTVTMVGDGDAKSQFGLRIGLGVATEQDARLIIPDSQHLAVELARLRHPGSGIVSADDGRTAPVKFYRIEHDDIASIAIMTGGIRPAPDPRLAEALGDVYARRWQDRGGHLISAVPARVPVVAPPGTTEAEFEQIVSQLGDIDVSAAAEPVNPARKRMRNFIERSPRGASPAAIMHLLDAEKMPTARSTIHRWLAEDERAGLLERGTFGKWHAKNAGAQRD